MLLRVDGATLAAACDSHVAVARQELSCNARSAWLHAIETCAPSSPRVPKCRWFETAVTQDNGRMIHSAGACGSGPHADRDSISISRKSYRADDDRRVVTQSFEKRLPLHGSSKGMSRPRSRSPERFASFCFHLDPRPSQLAKVAVAEHHQLVAHASPTAPITTFLRDPTREIPASFQQKMLLRVAVVSVALDLRVHADLRSSFLRRKI